MKSIGLHQLAELIGQHRVVAAGRTERMPAALTLTSCRTFYC